MADLLDSTLSELSPIQRKAVEWENGSLLVLAGPGSGKTRVLTSRVARILDRSRDQSFRVLALTFTNKAAHEMARRVAALVPGFDGGGVDIHTFHGFCARVLRQHGTHLGIKSDFVIYSRLDDRKSVLCHALQRDARYVRNEEERFLPRIDTLKARLVDPKMAEEWMTNHGGVSAREAERIALAYRLYEDELSRANALDFNSLIFEAYRLFGFLAIAEHYQRVYRFWLIDEFQDTNRGQYALLRRMAGGDYRQVFAVADDDQTIYEWNGANVRRICALVRDFECQIVQLPTNYRCPASIVEAANRLVVYNVRREKFKAAAEPVEVGGTIETRMIRDTREIWCREFATDGDEILGVAGEIARRDISGRGQTVVLARTRALLDSMRQGLGSVGVSTTLLMRRDDFISPQMRWLVACLKQINRPLDRRNMVALVEMFSSFASMSLDVDDVMARSAAEGVNCLSIWADMARSAGLSSPASEIVASISELTAGELKTEVAIERILEHLAGEQGDGDLRDDLSAWQRLSSEIRTAIGTASLDRFLQELELRSKEPVPVPGSVSLATIHGAKGLEFDEVYLIGLVEGILPAWYSVKQGDGSAAMEEERRSCFVAITRTKRRLMLSWAREYKGWEKRPSRFLAEMGFLSEALGRGGSGAERGSGEKRWLPMGT